MLLIYDESLFISCFYDKCWHGRLSDGHDRLEFIALKFDDIFRVVEAEYAHHLHRKLVPVRMQPKYRPDGWLGFLLGSTYFYDLTKEEEYEKKVMELVKALGEDAKILPGEGGPDRMNL